jgi:hypothetical protein
MVPKESTLRVNNRFKDILLCTSQLSRCFLWEELGSLIKKIKFYIQVVEKDLFYNWIHFCFFNRIYKYT